MNKYELIYILDAALEESARKELIAKFSQLIVDNGGEIEKVDEWGKRRLAYVIDYKSEGYYVMINFKAESTVPRELERNLEINESVIRYLVVKVLNKRSSVKPRPARPAFQAPAGDVSAAPADEVVEAVVAEEVVEAAVETAVEAVEETVEAVAPEAAE